MLVLLSSLMALHAFDIVQKICWSDQWQRCSASSQTCPLQQLSKELSLVALTRTRQKSYTNLKTKHSGAQVGPILRTGIDTFFLILLPLVAGTQDYARGARPAICKVHSSISF